MRVPTIAGHGIAAWAEFEKPLSPEDARRALAEADGVVLEDEPDADRYPTILASAGGDKAIVGRIRADAAAPNVIAFFSTCDNLRKGAALNAAQICELLIQRGLV